MTLHMLPYIQKDTAEKPNASIIWLHGLGADGHDFEPMVAELDLPNDMAIRFIFPHAPTMPVSLNDGYIMPAWYDIRKKDLGIEHDAAGVHHAAAMIQMLIDQEIMRGVPAHRIILAGFSQGAAMSLYVGLRQSEDLAGLMILSGYMLLPEEISSVAKPCVQTPVFMAHGKQDDVVPVALAEHGRDLIQTLGMQVSWHDYTMEHSVCAAEIRDIRAWIIERLR